MTQAAEPVPNVKFNPAATLMMSFLIIVFSLAAGPIFRYGLDTAEQVFDATDRSAKLTRSAQLEPGKEYESKREGP